MNQNNSSELSAPLDLRLDISELPTCAYFFRKELNGKPFSPNLKAPHSDYIEDRHENQRLNGREL